MNQKQYEHYNIDVHCDCTVLAELTVFQKHNEINENQKVTIKSTKMEQNK